MDRLDALKWINNTSNFVTIFDKLSSNISQEKKKSKEMEKFRS